jgi:hypothetical protein
VRLSPASLSFGSQLIKSTSVAKIITLKNTGTATLTISSIMASGDFARSTTCPSSLAAGAICSVSVTFHPTVTGVRAGMIVVTDNAKGSPQRVSLSGTGTAPVVHLSRTSITFPAQLLKTRSALQTVTLTNTGTAPLSLASIVVSGNFAQTNTCKSPIAVRASCAISVTFTPTALGSRTGTVRASDNASGSPQTVTLIGTGTEVKLSTTKLTFPATAVGKVSAAQTVTLTNVGTTVLSISSISLTGTNPVDFAETKTCGGTLAAGASCAIRGTFQPKVKGALSAILRITDNGGSSPQQVTLAGTGQ